MQTLTGSTTDGHQLITTNHALYGKRMVSKQYRYFLKPEANFQNGLVYSEIPWGYFTKNLIKQVNFDLLLLSTFKIRHLIHSNKIIITNSGACRTYQLNILQYHKLWSPWTVQYISFLRRRVGGLCKYVNAPESLPHRSLYTCSKRNVWPIRHLLKISKPPTLDRIITYLNVSIRSAVINIFTSLNLLLTHGGRQIYI